MGQFIWSPLRRKMKNEGKKTKSLKKRKTLGERKNINKKERKNAQLGMRGKCLDRWVDKSNLGGERERGKNCTKRGGLLKKRRKTVNGASEKRII